MTNEFSPNAITSQNELDFVDYAILSARTYHNPERIKFSISLLGWEQVNLNNIPIAQENTASHTHLSGLAYDIYHKNNSNTVVFAFRGTDGLTDWLFANLAIPPFNTQYIQAREEVEIYRKNNPGKNIVATGHSLGGGLALTVSVHFGIDAYTFDSSPRVFDGFKNHHAPAQRYLVFQDDEILGIVRKIWTKDDEVFESSNIFQCKYNFPQGIDSHRMDYLALSMLKNAAKLDKTYESVLSQVKNV